MRFVEICQPGWDHHNNLHKGLIERSRNVDQATAALLTDLGQRGLLEDTLVLFGSEFGRQPNTQGADERDHNITGYSMFLADAGVKNGNTHGATDEFGIKATKGRMHTNDLHATSSPPTSHLPPPRCSLTLIHGASAASDMKLNHPTLVDSLRKAYSAEKAASFAYVGHAGSLKAEAEKKAVKQIEDDEWHHRSNILGLMQKYEIPVSRYYELKYHVIGKIIGYSCYLIGRFMPYFFAGKLESGNVCEYFVMIRHFHSLGITEHDAMLHEMGVKEKEHEVYFLNMIKDARWLPLFESIFAWGRQKSSNDLDLENIRPATESEQYCKK